MRFTDMPWRRWIRRFLITLILVPALVLVAWSWITLRYVYARGERAGYLQKFSLKGWVFKTWEGELALVNLPGAMPEIFHFTVRDPAVSPAVESMIGKRVAITYEQHRGIPSRIFGDTEYFVVRVSTA